jgi:hypothetical protein
MTVEIAQPAAVPMAIRQLVADGSLPPVKAAKVQPVRFGGMVGSVVRVLLTYPAGQPTGPASLILKTPAVALAESAELTAAEVSFYGAVGTTPEVNAATVYAAGIEPTFLVLADLGEAGFVRQIDGCTPVQARKALRHVARMHAAWWDALPPQLSWLQTPNTSIVTAFCRRWLHAYDRRWPDELEGVPELVVRDLDRIAARLAGRPHAVIHGDFHSQNLCFGSGDSVVMVDFQTVQRGSPLLDVARFLATSLTTQTRRQVEAELLDDYRETLERLAIRIAETEFFRDLRAGLLWNLVMPLALHVQGILTAGEQWPPTLPMLRRCVQAAIDWEAVPR